MGVVVHYDKKGCKENAGTFQTWVQYNKEAEEAKMSTRNFMDDLIEALQIFKKYTDGKIQSTYCQDDALFVAVDPSDVTHEDLNKLEKLGFEEAPEYGSVFVGYKFSD